MAMTIAFNVRDSENVAGKYKENIIDLTLDNSYPALGYPLATVATGFKLYYMVIPLQNATNGIGFDFFFDTTNQTIRAVVSSTGAEVGTGSASLNGVTVRCLVIGY